MRTVRAVQFDADSVVLQYVDEETDVRADGSIYQTHTISVARGSAELDDEIAAAEDAVAALLAEAVKTWATSLPFDLQAALNQRS